MPIRLEGIHFLVTYRCTYACDHCFVWGSPDAEDTMTLAQLTSVIEQAAELGVTDVYFEGGEPTLAYPVVLAAAKRAREHGLDVGMVSNCFWATSLKDAKVWLEPLAELGLADLSLSSYAYFVEDADEEHLRNAVLAAQDLGVPTSVLEVGAPADIGVPGACSGDVGEVMHKGRAAVVLASARASRPPETLTTCPHEDFTDPGRTHVGPDGELQICQGISAGNVFAGGDGPWPPANAAGAPANAAAPPPGGLRRVLDAYDPQARPIVREIIAGGPWALAQASGHTPARSHYADECHLCYEVRAALRAAGRYPEVLAPGQCYAENETAADPGGDRYHEEGPMASECERFWEAGSYAVVGHQASKKPFPKITYGALKERGATVYPMDPEGGAVEGDKAYSDFSDLPSPVQAAVLELPKEETAAWVGKAADAGIEQIWIHQMTDTPEALAQAEQRGLKVITGHCAVMYNKPGMSMHAPHRWIWKLLGKY